MKKKKLGLSLALKKIEIDEDPIPLEIEIDDPSEKIYHAEDSIYFSGYQGAKDKAELKQNNIKTIVNLTLKNCDSHYKDEFDYLEYDIRDLPGEKMQEFFGEIADTLEGQNKKEGGCLVHCAKGISRAPSVIIAWLIKYKGMKVENALDLLQGISKRVDPNAGFLIQLNTMEHMQCVDR